MIEVIKFDQLNNSREESTKYYVNYGNEKLSPFFAERLGQSRDFSTDKLVFNFMLYAINHYEKFQDELSYTDKQKVLFSICRSVPYLSSQIISGDSVQGVVDKYSIRHVEGFEDNSIFKDLKYLQKITTYDQKPHHLSFYGSITDEEIDAVAVEMFSTIRSIIVLELDEAKTKEEKIEERKAYIDVKQYSSISTLAAFYRELQRLEDAQSNLKYAIETLDEERGSNPEKCLFVVLRAVGIVGEFSTQKNLAVQTRLNNPDFTRLLNKIKNITNDLVKPDQYTKFTEDFIQSINFDELKKQLQYLLEGLKTLAKVSAEASLTEKVQYYTEASPTKIPYLSDDLIGNLNNFVDEEFPGLGGEERNTISELLSSDRNEKFIKGILSICKPQNEHKKAIFKEYKALFQAVKTYTPLAETEETALPISEIEKLASLFKEADGIIPAKDSARSIMETLSQFLHTEVAELPSPMEEDNPIALPLSKLKVGQTTIGSFIVMEVRLPENATRKIKLQFSDEIFSTIQSSIQVIRDHLGDKHIYFPKKFFDLGDEYIKSAPVDLNKFEIYFKSNTEEVLDYIINFGKFCKVCHFIASQHNQQAIEFLLQTSYQLLKEANEEDEDTVFCGEEYRGLRHAIRHYEDNFDVMEVSTPIEEVYAHYSIRFLGELEQLQ